MEEKRDETVMREGNISLILESYNDIFSSFDPRPYSEKALSDDFLIECRKAARDKNEDIELRLLISKEKRNLNDEAKIKKRLKEHFQKHLHEKERAIKRQRTKGFTWFIFGAILILVTTLFIVDKNSLLFKFLTVVFEPAGWFIAWAGLDDLLVKPREKFGEYHFYKKMANAQVLFLSY